MTGSTRKNSALLYRAITLDKQDLDDRALVAALKMNETGARELLYDRYATHVQRVLARVLGVDTALPGLLNDVFIEVFTHIHSIKNGDRLKGWLTSVSVFTARGYIRKRNRSLTFWFGETAAVPEIATFSVNYEMREALLCTYRILDRMPADERIAFALRFLEGMELKEVAEATRVSLATTKRRLARAKKKFFTRAKEFDALSEWVDKYYKWRSR